MVIYLTVLTEDECNENDWPDAQFSLNLDPNLEDGGMNPMFLCEAALESLGIDTPLEPGQVFRVSVRLLQEKTNEQTTQA